jgi:diguanylate cyclase (GGDEF)-like protein
LVDVTAVSTDQLPMARIVFLGVAIAIIPVVIGTRELAAGDALGLLLAGQGTLVAALVMARIGLLSAQRTRAERSLEHQATHDPLTLLPNRRQFVGQLRDELNRGARCALLFFDLDGFKPINDRFGHDVGDSVLVDVARRLVACVDAPHVVCRFGGDEFAALLVDTTPDLVQAVRNCVEAELRRPFEQAPGATVGVSTGVAFADDERDPEQLIRVADQAMYREKTAHAGNKPPTR